MKRRACFFLSFLFTVVFTSALSSAQSVPSPENSSRAQALPETQPEFAGVLFDVPIPTGNYYFVLKTATTFGTPWGGIPQNADELKKRVENDLVLSYEAFRRNISVTPEELDEEITKTMKGHKSEVDHNRDHEGYVQWVQDTLGGPTEFFENQMRHLIQLKKLQKEILDSVQPVVTDDEAFQEFLNEYNTLSIELVQFDEPEEAEKFYQKARKDKKFWDKEKEKNPDQFKRPGFVALEFLMYMWQLPKKAVYDMIEMEVGAVYPPTPIYRGEGVFRVMEIRRADEAQFPRLKESYYEQLKTQKKYEEFSKWLDNLRKESGIRIDLPLPDFAFQASSQ